MNAERLEALIQKVRSLPDTAARDAALELVQAVMDLHASGIERMMEIVHASEAGDSIFEAYAADDRVRVILLLHDLHPLDLEERVRRALDQPAFHSRGATVEVLSVRDGVARIHIEGGPALRSAVEQALSEAAPDAVEVIVEGGAANHSPANFVPLTQLLARVG
ncbi:MAG: nitrogen fixation protein NifU [Bryobacteraceae bacterium]